MQIKEAAEEVIVEYTVSEVEEVSTVIRGMDTRA